jgi:hypothetical protein
LISIHETLREISEIPENWDYIKWLLCFFILYSSTCNYILKDYTKYIKLMVESTVIEES